MNTQSADGWLISAIYINDERVPIEEHSVNYFLKIDSDTVILIQFITLEVSTPTGSEYIYDGSDIVAYADDALYTVVGGNATDGLIPLLSISDGDDIPVKITLSLPSVVSGDHVQGMSLSFTLAVGVYFSQQGI